MMRVLDTVVLRHDIAEHGLVSGDVGAVVHAYEGGTAFEVEFVTAEGKTVALLTLGIDDVRSMSNGEILHVRDLATA